MFSKPRYAPPNKKTFTHSYLNTNENTIIRILTGKSIMPLCSHLKPPTLSKSSLLVLLIWNGYWHTSLVLMVKIRLVQSNDDGSPESAFLLLVFQALLQHWQSETDWVLTRKQSLFHKSKLGLGAVTKSAFCLCEKHYIRFFLENIVAKWYIKSCKHYWPIKISIYSINDIVGGV